MRTRLMVAAAVLVSGAALGITNTVASGKSNGDGGDHKPQATGLHHDGEAQDGLGDKAPTTEPGATNKALKALSALTPGVGIDYHGGPVMKGANKVYVIWYGNWSNTNEPNGVGIIKDFFTGLSGSPYFKINNGYTDTTGAVAPAFAYGGETTDAYSQGSSRLSDGAIQRIVTNAISRGKLVNDPTGVYFVLTSKDVTKSGFLTQYCGWHTYTTIGTAPIKYSFVGDASRNLGACAAQTTGSPNGNPAVDAMVSVIAHELSETVTDPQLNAWYDSAGAENADKCAWTFGTTYAAGGGRANMQLGTRNFLIQQNWKISGACALA